MRKIINFILSAIIAFSIIAVTPATVTVSATSSLKAGDKFFAQIDAKTGKVTGAVSTDAFDLDDPMYRCVVKEDGTVSIELYFWSPFEFTQGAAFLDAKNLTPGEILTIPEKVNGYTVSEIAGTYGFTSAAVKKIVIPQTVQTISEYAFVKCFFLEEVEFAGKSQLKEIGYGAFVDCRHLKSIIIPASVETIGDFAFYCTTKSDRSSGMYLDGHLGFNLLTINSSVKAFDNIKWENDKVSSYDISKPELVFDDVYSLTSVRFEDGSKATIGENVFKNQPLLKDLVLPKTSGAMSWHVSAEDLSKALAESGIPTNFKAITGNKSVSLTWTAPQGASSYAVYYKRATASKWKKVTDTKNAYVNLNGFKNGVDYSFKIVTDKGAESAEINATPTAEGATFADKLTITSADSNSAGIIEVSWADVGADTYMVYIAEGNSTNYKRCGKFSGTSAKLDKFGKGDKAAKLVSGNSYKIRVVRSDYSGDLAAALGECPFVTVKVK